MSVYPHIISCFFSVLSGFLIYVTLVFIKQRWANTLHHLMTYMMLPPISFVITKMISNNFALSLGMIGALSIVRFRTPIKEPEELVYLFLAIAIGLGYAAGQALLTSVIILAILIINYFWLSNQKIYKSVEYNLVISWTDEDITFEKMTDVITHYVDSIKLIRLEHGLNTNTAVLLISPRAASDIEKLTKNLIKLDDKLTVSFYEAKANW